jgi:hypothetical protein
MGITTDSIDSYVKRDLNKKFPASMGWHIERNPEWDEISFDYMVSRRYFGKKSQNIVDVIIEKKVSEKIVSALEEKIAALESKGINGEKVFVVVPTGADVSLVPENIGVMYLKILKVTEGDILWWRKTPLH